MEVEELKVEELEMEMLLEDLVKKEAEAEERIEDHLETGQCLHRKIPRHCPDFASGVLADKSSGNQGRSSTSVAKQ